MTEATTEQEVSTKVEERRAEERMSPLQQATSQARHEVLSHEQDLLAEGVTREQVQSAAERAGKRVEVEYKEKEAQDPLVRIEKALLEAAETEDERDFAEMGRAKLEAFRAGWVRAIGEVRTLAVSSGKPEPPLQEAVRQARMRFLSPSSFRYRDDGEHPTTGLYMERKSGETLTSPPGAFTERFLRATGALSESQTLNDLRRLPLRKDERSPGAGQVGGNANLVERLPTSIPGVEVGYNFGLKQPSIEVNADALQKIIDFPTSA